VAESLFDNCQVDVCHNQGNAQRVLKAVRVPFVLWESGLRCGIREDSIERCTRPDFCDVKTYLLGWPPRSASQARSTRFSESRGCPCRSASGCVVLRLPLSLRMVISPFFRSRSFNSRPQTSDALMPWRKAIRIIARSRGLSLTALRTLRISSWLSAFINATLAWYRCVVKNSNFSDLRPLRRYPLEPEPIFNDLANPPLWSPKAARPD
jgi:hypothetical protein